MGRVVFIAVGLNIGAVSIEVFPVLDRRRSVETLEDKRGKYKISICSERNRENLQ